MYRTTHALRVTLAAAALACAATAQAQFPITESFMNGTAPGWTLLGNAALTASAAGGNLDPAGSGWLRLTSATGNQAGSAIFNTAFSSTSGIAITFDYADYGGTGADGFTFYLINGATASPTVGAYGGPLGYAGRYGNITTTRCANGTMSVTTPGVTNGYVGIGFDEFGNFSNCESGWNALSTTTQQPQSVVIRGSGSLSTAKAFKYLTSQRVNVAPFNSTIDGAQRSAPRKARVSIVNERITVAIDFGAGFQTVINAFNLRGDPDQAALPATFKMGISGSTGGSTNIHEIRNVRVELPANITLGQTAVPSTVSVGDTVTFTITIANDATNAALGSALTDAFPAGLANVSWTAATTGGATVSRGSGTGNLAETVNLPKSSSITYTVTATVTAAGAGTTLSNTVTLAPPAGVANLLSNTIATHLTVNKMGSATALASSANPSRSGQPVTLTATVTAVAPGSGTPAGTVTFLDGATTLGTGTLNASGVATLTTSALAVGTHALTASYGGAANFNASTSSPAVSQVVNQALTATALASGANPSVAGQPVTLTATVTAQAPGAGTPTGTVTFLDGATSLGSAALNGSGVATLTSSALAVGTRSITAAYGGATSFATSTSPALSQVVNKVTPTAVVASGTNPSRFGQPVTFTATLAPVAPGTGTPTGSVTFLDGATALGTAALNGSGVATLTTSALPVGSRSVTVSYPGDARFLAGTSPAITQAVNAAATSTALASATNPSVTGQAVTFTATVTATSPGGGTPSGQVTFLDGATALGTAALDGSGVATLTTSALGAGSHAITAAYLATASHGASASPVVTQVVDRAATQTVLAAAGGTPVTGQARTFTATVTAVAPGAGTPTGTVTFSEGATVLGSAALDAAGTASLPVTLAAGSHTLTATYGGSAAFSGSSGTAAAPVNQAASSTALTAGPSPALFGEPVALVATVSPVAPGAGARTGTVTFLDGATVLGTAPVDAAGQATLDVSTLAVGPHALTAAYGGDAGFLSSTSPAADVSVVPAPTSTTVASSLLTATFGDPLTLTAAVAVVAPGAGTPVGTVRFFAGGIALGDATLDAAGQASLPVAGGLLVAGAHELTAAYLGTAAFQASTSAAITQAVARAATTVAVTGPGPTVTGQAATFTASVAVPAGLRAAGGTVSFFDGATFLGTGTLDAAGQATFSTAALAAGPHAITATYGGDADYAGSASAAAPHQVAPAATATALAAAPAPSVFGAPVTLDATVTAVAPGAGTPGGTVTFLDGTTVLGTAPLDGAGHASLSTAALSGGAHSLTARYEGSAAFSASTSAPVAQVVDPAATTTSLATSGSPSVLGQAVTFTATVGSAAGTPTGTVTFLHGVDVLGTAPLSGGVAALVVSGLPIGTHVLEAVYGGSPDHASGNAFVDQVVTQAGADVALAAAPSPAVAGEPVTLTVLVTARAPGAGTPSGTVRILDGATVLGTATLAGGVATFTTADLPVGVHLLTAEYAGDASFLPGATAVPAVLAIDPAATTTALAVSAAASVFTEPVTFTATVTVLAPGAGVPTGTVTFAEGTTTLGTAAVQVDGTAALTLPALAVGAHDVTATYGGDPSFALSVSDPAHHDVAAATALVAVASSPAPSVVGQTFTFTVTVTPVAPALGPVAGSVTLREGAAVLGTAALDAAGQATFASATLAAGSHLLTADFTGAGFGPASSGLTHQVDPAATATTLAAAPAPSVSGEPVRLTASVAVLAPGAGTPAGSVTFLDGGSPIGAGSLDASGVATLDVPLLAGAHLLTAAYVGDGSFLPSSSAGLDHPVDLGATATTVAAAPSPAVYGEPLTLTADVAVAPPSTALPAGPVTFTIDGLPAGSAVVGAGQAVLLVPAGLDAGLHQVVATFTGSPELSGSTSAPAALLVTPAPAALALAASPSPGQVGEPTVLRATASAAFGVPAGTVTFTDGGATLGTAVLDPTGVAELQVGPLALGAHELAATLPASANHGAASGTASLQVERAPTSTDLQALPATAVTGQSVSFTATVTPASPGAGLPTGTITFLEGTTVLGTGTLAPAGTGAQATFSTASLPPGPHAITAAFPGDAARLASTSPAAQVTVGPAATTLALSAAPSPATFGQAVTLAAQVAVVAPGAGTPAGTVTFLDGATVLGTAALDAAGLATLSLPLLPGGAHALTARYDGDASFAGSTSAAAPLTVEAAATALALATSGSPSRLGEPVTLTAAVTSAAGTPGGTVTFRDGVAVLGAAALDGAGLAVLAVPGLALGSHALAADYAGTPDFAAASGAATQVVVQGATDVALSALPSPAVTGEPVTLTVLVTARAPASGTPGGTVRLFDGGAPLGTAALAGGVATFTTADLPVGVHALTAEYDGDDGFLAGATAAPTLLAIDPAATATALAASAPASVFTEPVTFTATVAVLLPGAGLPAGTVTFSEGAETLGTAAVQPDGTAALVLPALPVGPHDVVATYGGDPAFALSVSDPLHHQVSTAAAAVAVSSTPSPSRAGEPVTITVAVAPAAPALGPVAGSVTLRDGATVLGTAALDAAGRATFTTATLEVGAHLLAADFTGAGFADATSPDHQQLVSPAATATAVAAAPHPAIFGQDLTLTATVSVLAPGDAPLAGTVDFTLDGAPVGSAALSGGLASLVLPGGSVPSGLHQVAASYAGGAATEGSASPATDLLVSGAPSTLVLDALPAAPVAGQPVVLRATASSAFGTPSGAVAFTVDGQPLPPVALDAAGLAELPIGPLAAGSHAIEVRFPGTADFGEAVAAGTLAVTPAATATALVSDRAGALSGQPVAFTATVTVPAPGAGQPSGLVTFLDGATVLGTAALDAGGQATLVLATLAPGAHAVTASFPGTADLSASTSGAAAVTVSAAPTALTLAPAPDAPVAGQPVTLTATVTVPAPGAGQPAGLVTFTDGTAVLGTAALDAAGQATLTTAALTTGAHALSASWPGDARLLGSDGSAPLQVAPAASATTLVAQPAAAVTGQAVRLTATVTAVAPGAAPVTGEVTFLEGAAVLGTATLDAAGLATLSLATLAPGAHAVTAAFPGNGDLLASASAPAAVTVGPAETTLVLSASPSPSVAGQPVTLAAQIAVSAPGAGAPAGTVTFSDGATVLGTAALDGAGRATLTVADLAVGVHALTAAWPGDAALLGSSGGAALPVAVSPTTTLVSAAPSAPTFGQPVTLTATVAPAGGGAGAPGGTVTFLDGATVLGTAPVGAGGVATLVVDALGAGHHEVSATYGGDGTFAASGSAAAATVEVARAASQVALQASPSPATAGQAVTLTATVASGAGTPGGTVTFLDGTTVLGTATVGADGVATLTVTLSAGDHALAAEASGDAGHLPATGSATLIVEKAASQLAVTTSRTPSRAGRPVTFTATVTAPPAAAGTVVFWDDSGATPVRLGSAPLVDGAAALTTRDLAKGTHPIRAEYLGTDLVAAATATLAGGEVIENTPPVAGAGAALALGGAGAPAAAASATIPVAGSPVDAAQGTVEVWLRATWTDAAQAGPAPAAVRLGAAGAPHWSLGVAPDRRGVVVTLGAATATVPAALDDLAWHHLALVGDAGGTTLLLDGAEIGTLAEPFGAAAAEDLVIGEGFVGEVDELRTWSTTRTAAQLAAAARRPLGGAEPGLTGLWRFDDGSGLELLDAGPNHLDGTIALVDPSAAAPAPFAASQAWRDRQVASGAAMAPAAAGYDADGDPLTLTIAVAPAHGTATVDQAGLQVGYTSTATFGGQDALTFTLSDGEAASDYALSIAVAAPATCTATAQCGGGNICFQGACVPDRDLDVRAGGCGCGNAGGGALALWSVLSLALLRRRRPAARRSP